VDLVVISGIDLAEILQVIVENLKTIFQIDACCILLWEDDTGLTFTTGTGF
jgi:hypothetical protein